jgi:hypothetical protein
VTLNNNGELFLKPGSSSYQLRVTATDNAGNTTTETGQAFQLTAVPQNNRAIAYTGTWQRQNVAGAYGGKAQVSTAPGSTATLTFAGGRQIAWVGGATGGVADVSVNGGAPVRVQLGAGGQRRLALFVADAPVTTLRVTVVSGRVDVEAFVVLQ